jgi:hypothetical protein
VVRKPDDGKATRKALAPFARARRVAAEPVEEIAGRVRQIASRAANDNEPPLRLATLGRPLALALVSAALGGVIAALLLS